MLPVYICEDEEQIRNMERAWLEKQILIQGYDMKVVLSTGNPEELLECLDRKSGQGIYFLDVELKGASMNGFQLGKEIRKRDGGGFLIYVTAFPDLAFETFRYHLEALDYICKQNPERMYTDLSRCLDTVTERMSKMQNPRQEYFTLKTPEMIRHIPLGDILYFATSSRTHRIELHAENELFDFSGSIQELEKDLGEGFIRVHRAYLVHGEQIDWIDVHNRELVLKNGERCPFSRRMRQELLKRGAVWAVK